MGMTKRWWIRLEGVRDVCVVEVCWSATLGMVSLKHSPGLYESFIPL